MRAVEDHHVDRPDVEVQQCMKLTGTNPSIGLILPRDPLSDRSGKQQRVLQQNPFTALSLDDLVASARGPAPDPIPNSAVKSLSANGTAS